MSDLTHRFTQDVLSPKVLHGTLCKLVFHPSGNLLLSTRKKVLVEFSNGFRYAVDKDNLVLNQDEQHNNIQSSFNFK